MKKTQEEADFLDLYQQVYESLYRFALYTLQNQQDAEDIVSDTVLAAWQQFDSLRSREAFKGWVFKILTNKCNQKMREYYHKTSSLDEIELSHEPNLAEAGSVREAFSSLSEEERLIVSMSVFGGYKEKEIASILHQNYNTVRSKYSRALQKMKVALQD